ncbi:DUF924 family protein [Phormidium tenue]|uniref:DUF924 domain-containing protein n=1 Tax=Phormidium tenue NIES-30 TaxID=549789 RepID=A0A1U7JA83_9CYAN|nr:DUF924 family protein [Phormidium tenue]MBD2230598.1 DUF924 domain-containing protein [Phormidium tenue FACHB-1052]OKH50636.1 hypothetical protein NIES30_00580 [Phormidium tenue NIES-30]
MERWQAILRFWFGDPENPGSEYGQQRRVWFKKDPAFDDTIRQRFLPDYEQAAAGALATWRQEPRSCLALVILLDQFPRNLFRGEARSFASDRAARDTANYALAQGYDQQVLPVERIFFYLPLEHSENLADQERSVKLVRSLHAAHPEFESCLDYALRHRDIIQRFGRFPHRNEILGREATPAEAEFLQQPGSRF